MITYKIWEELFCTFFVSPIDYLWAILGSIITIPIDFLLFPLEILALIVYKIKEKE